MTVTRWVTVRAAGLALIALLGGCDASAPPSAGVAGDATPTSAPAPATVGASPPTAKPAPAATPSPVATPSPAATPSRAGEPEPAPPLAGMVIAVDPGHNGGNGAHPEQIRQPVDAGGFDKACNTVGAQTAGGYTEAQFNLELARKLEHRLRGAGATVHLTRERNDGVGPCIDERGRLAGEVGADVLISVHADGGPQTGRGFHLIRPDEVPGYTEEIVAGSAELAEALRDALIDAQRPPADYVGGDGLVVRDDLGTLNNSEVPAVLVELGNLRHAEEAAFLASEAGQAQLAQALTAGVIAYASQR